MTHSKYSRSKNCNPELNAEDQLWPDDEDEFARICGLR